MKHILLTFAILAPSLTMADDFTVEERPFKIETKLQAVFLPTDTQPVRIKPEAWHDFPITSLVSQGATVKKGDTMIGIDSEKIDEHIANVEKGRKAAELSLTQAKHELAQLEINTPRKLEDAARLEKELTENLKWYTETGHPKEIEEAKFSVTLTEQKLSYSKEELRQLLIMYKEDDKIEETEEIILTRTRNGVAALELGLKFARIKSKQSLDTTIPRKLLSKQRTLKNAQIANTSAKEKLPRELEQKRLAVAKAIRNDEKAKENLAKLKSDRAMMNITAPADGVVYYGNFENGRWAAETANKVLHIGGKLPANTTVMTLIPAESPLVLSTFTEEANLQALQAPKAHGRAITSLNRYQSFPVTISKISDYPETNGSFRVTLKPNLPKDIRVVPGMKATATITSSKIDKALTIPTAYLQPSDDGNFTVKLKLADGKTSPRTVTVGPANKEWVVISKGLDIGQVIVK